MTPIKIKNGKLDRSKTLVYSVRMNQAIQQLGLADKPKPRVESRRISHRWPSAATTNERICK
jgi:hypothetical protein